jgi:hypothetical protein
MALTKHSSVVGKVASVAGVGSLGASASLQRLSSRELWSLSEDEGKWGARRGPHWRDERRFKSNRLLSALVHPRVYPPHTYVCVCIRAGACDRVYAYVVL